MKRLLDGFIISLGMFSVIPVPKIWNDKAFHLVIPAFPLVGLIFGCLWYGFAYLLTRLSIPLTLCAALVSFFPLFLSGFIHIDGYMDTCDAISSRTELEQKRNILKDSHVGAFAVIFLGVYLLLGFSSVYAALERNANMSALVFIPVLSRCLAGSFLLNAKPISEIGLGATFRKNTKPIHTAVLFCFAASCFIAGFCLGGINILLPLTVLLISGVVSALYVIRQFDGISGDLCGFIITVSELCALLALAVR